MSGIDSPSICKVYPRVCGGTRFTQNRQVEGTGLSPRVRGNRRQQTAKRGCRRSIPACAGEPGVKSAYSRQYPVYPRVCGGTW